MWKSERTIKWTDGSSIADPFPSIDWMFASFIILNGNRPSNVHSCPLHSNCTWAPFQLWAKSPFFPGWRILSGNSWEKFECSDYSITFIFQKVDVGTGMNRFTSEVVEPSEVKTVTVHFPVVMLYTKARCDQNKLERKMIWSPCPFQLPAYLLLWSVHLRWHICWRSHSIWNQ